LNDIQRSEIVIAKVLSLLMDWGIQDCDLKFRELELDDDFGPFFFPCVNWLTEEGIIRTGQVRRTMDAPAGGTVMHPVLTSYGMSILGHMIKIDGQTIGLEKAVRNVSENKRSYAQAGDFFGGILGGFTKSIGS
jgi:hypothetical protein